MAWTVPRTYTTSEILTAGIFNTHISDNLQYLYDNRFDSTNFDYDPMVARCTVDTVVQTFRTDVTGCSLTLTRNGDWWIIGVFDVLHGGVGADDVNCELDIAGVIQTGIAYSTSNTGTRGTIVQMWTYTATAQPKTIKLRNWCTNAGIIIKTPATAILALCGQAP